jgi:2-methylfumaryl-CoA isomerase
MDGPLTGMRVVEVSTFVAAPLGGMTLAQLGADVIRVDPLGGAVDHRRWPLAESGASLYWAGLNKGKRSLCVDLRAPEGRELVTRLVAESGILLTNAAIRGLDHDTLAAVRPDLIALRITGRADGSTAVDYTVNAELGFPMVTGPEDHDGPVNHVLPAWDIACGLYAAIGILSAERRRRTTGQGQSITLPLYDVALAMAGNLGFLAEAQFGGVRQRIGNHLYGSFARDFETRDGRRVMVVALTPRHWTDLVGAAGLTGPVSALEQALGADFGREGDRFEHREALAGLLHRWFAQRDLAEVTDALTGTSVLWSVYRTFTEVVADDALRADPLMATVDQPGIGPYFAPGSPLDFGARTVERAPVLGEHTDEILRTRLGLDPDRIRRLREQGVI